MTFRKILVAIGKTLMWGLIALVVIYGLLLAINAVDEQPTPELQSLLAIPQIKDDSTNGYLALVGSTLAPANEDFVDYGRQWVEAYNAAAGQAALETATARFPFPSPSSSIKFVGDDKQLCNPMMTLCLPLARERAAVWRKLAADNKMMLDRQQRLQEFTHFEYSYFPPSFGSPLPPFPTQFRPLMLDIIALDAAEGRIEPALAALEARVAFDRRALLGSGGSVLMAMMSASWLRQDYALLAEIVATRPKVTLAQKARLVRMTEPLEIEQLRTIAGRMVEGEFRSLARASEWTEEDMRQLMFGETYSNVLMRPFFKTQATKNLIAHYQSITQAYIRDFSPENADALGAKYMQILQSAFDDLFLTWRVMYNPVGKVTLSASAVPAYDEYILKLANLMGIMRLARLQVELVTDGIKEADISARIAANKALYDPYSGKPMGWDAVKRQLYFDVHGKVQSGAPKRIQVGI